MVSKMEYMGDDGWELGFEVTPGDYTLVQDITEEGKPGFYYIWCEPDDSATLVYELYQGQYTWISDSCFALLQDVQPAAILRSGREPYAASLFESEEKRLAVQISHEKKVG